MPEKKNEIRFEEIEPNHLVAITKFAKVDKVTKQGSRGAPEMFLTDVDKGGKFSVEGKELIEGCMSADSVLSTKKITRTAMAEILTQSWNQPLTARFQKQNGEMRTMRGRLLKPEPLMGRSSVEDLDVKKTSHERGVRLVCHRTLDLLVVGGVKYELKK